MIGTSAIKELIESLITPVEAVSSHLEHSKIHSL